MKPMGQKTIKVEVKRGKTGLWYGTSPDLKGLLIAAKNEAQVLDDAPKTIAALYHASGVETVNIRLLGRGTFLARPEPIESAATIRR